MPKKVTATDLALCVMLLIWGCSKAPKTFAPSSPVIFPQQINHQPFEGVLRDHVKDGIVDYPAIAKDPRLGFYLDHLDRIDPGLIQDPRERLAFWINAYNAFAIQGIIDCAIPFTWFGKYRYFLSSKYRVGGGQLNLYGLEHEIIIPLGESRIHFAIVCGSKSCPPLRSEVYTKERLDAQLNDQARRFINDPERNRFDKQNNIAYLSRIFKWFRADFEEEAGSLACYVARFVEDPELARHLKADRYGIDFLEYDWHTNGPLLVETGSR